MEIISVLKIVLIFFGLGGLGISSYIFRKKRAKKVLVCPIGADCDSVVHSDFSKFFGVPLEMIGLFYYGLVIASYSFFLLFPNIAHPSAVFAVIATGATALIFSAYLTFIQAFSLRQWCTWCIGSAIISFFIFFISLLATDIGLVSLMEENYDIFSTLYILGISLGFGGAVISNILFFKFLKDYRISKFEADTIKTLSQITWLALAIFILSGIGLYLPEANWFFDSSVSFAKVVAVFLIIMAGAVLDLLISPRMIKKSLDGDKSNLGVKVGYGFYEKVSFALGGVVISSWIFILAMVIL